MTKTTIRDCDSVIAIPQDGAPAEVVPVGPGGPEEAMERLGKTGRFKGVWLHFTGPGNRIAFGRDR